MSALILCVFGVLRQGKRRNLQHTKAMNSIWLKRLKQIHNSDLEDSGGEVNPQLALEVCALCLRCSSQRLAVHRVTVWKRAKRTWERKFPLVNLAQNYLQNYVYGTFYTREERLVDFEVRYFPHTAQKLQLTRKHRNLKRRSILCCFALKKSCLKSILRCLKTAMRK